MVFLIGAAKYVQAREEILNRSIKVLSKQIKLSL